MDPERQPLLTGNAELRRRRFRHLSYEEVQSARTDIVWRKARCLLVFLLWAVIATCLSLIACIVITTPKCKPDQMPTVPPVHMTLAPLISASRVAGLAQF